MSMRARRGAERVELVYGVPNYTVPRRLRVGRFNQDCDMKSCRVKTVLFYGVSCQATPPISSLCEANPHAVIAWAYDISQ